MCVMSIVVWSVSLYEWHGDRCIRGNVQNVSVAVCPGSSRSVFSTGVGEPCERESLPILRAPAASAHILSRSTRARAMGFLPSLGGSRATDAGPACAYLVLSVQ